MKLGYRLQILIEGVVNRRRFFVWERNERRRCKSKTQLVLEDILLTILIVVAINLYLFQLYVIPSGSMQDTLLIGDRVAVNKMVYGAEILPNWGKFNGYRSVERADVIAFVSPSGQPPNLVHGIIQRFLFYLSLATIDLDQFRKVPLGKGAWRELRPEYSPSTIQAFAGENTRLGSTPLLVKRAVGFPGDTLRFIDGNLFVRSTGGAEFVAENDWKQDLGLNYEQHRDRQLKHENTYIQRVWNSYALNPQDAFLSQRFWHEVLGYFIPEGKILPLGDNRDNSYDGRWFGLVEQQRLIGEIVLRFWPLSRLRLVN